MTALMWNRVIIRILCQQMNNLDILCITGNSRFCSKMCQVWNISMWYAELKQQSELLKLWKPNHSVLYNDKKNSVLVFLSCCFSALILIGFVRSIQPVKILTGTVYRSHLKTELLHHSCEALCTQPVWLYNQLDHKVTCYSCHVNGHLFCCCYYYYTKSTTTTTTAIICDYLLVNFWTLLVNLFERENVF